MKRVLQQEIGYDNSHPIDDVEIYFHDNEYRARYYNMELTSAFQPIYSFAHKEPIGYEALVRITHEERGNISPFRFFSMFDGQKEISMFDHLLCTLHLKNFKHQFRENTWLFLNVRSRGIDAQVSFVDRLSLTLDEVGILPSQIVIEVVEDEIKDDALFDIVVTRLRKLGCLMALDDFGAGSSNFDRIWKISPDIVKIDRAMLVRASKDPKAKYILQELVPLLHGCNSFVLLEGIESEVEALLAMQVDADFMQGYLFGKPEKQLLSESSEDLSPAVMCRQFQHHGIDQSDFQKRLRHIKNLFQQSADALFAEQPVESAFFRLFKEDIVDRCYILRDDGKQIRSVSNVNSPNSRRIAQTSPLIHTVETSLSRRPYFRNAIARPGEVIISRPYLSLVNAMMCVTLSIAWPVENELHVICCDINAEFFENARGHV